MTSWPTSDRPISRARVTEILIGLCAVVLVSAGLEPATAGGVIAFLTVCEEHESTRWVTTLMSRHAARRLAVNQRDPFDAE